MKVLKFGSSAISSIEQFNKIADIIRNESDKKIVVLSAMEGTTHALEEIADYLYKKNPDGAKELISALEQKYYRFAEELFNEKNEKEEILQYILDTFSVIRGYSDEIFTLFEEKRIIALGSQICTHLMTAYLSACGTVCENISALKFMKIDKNEEPDEFFIRTELKEILAFYEGKEINTFITEGSVCRNAYNEVDLLGKGGNDYTAALIGAVLRTNIIELWSDSIGIYNNNPNIVSGAKHIESLSFEEAAELSYFLTHIIHPTCILPAKLANVPVRLMNIDHPDKQGTLISTNNPSDGKCPIKVIAAKDGIISILIKSSRMLFAHGFLSKVFEVFDQYKTSIDMITTSEIGVSVTIDNSKNLEAIIDDLKSFGTVSYTKEMTIISVIGNLPENSVGIQSDALSALKEIPIRMISYGGSAHNISFLVRTKDKSAALQALNKQLFGI